ncbi:18946_t:CDS:2, partial [Gigaspora margarita]
MRSNEANHCQEDFPNSIFSRIIHTSEVIGCYNGHGPNFGCYFRMQNDNKK